MPVGLISDLSRLRARWERLEKRIVTLNGEVEVAMEDEVPKLLEKVQEAEEKLEATKAAVAVEERRLFAPDAKLRFTPARKKEAAGR